MSAEALALYVHLPWCVRKCPYCDFNSYAQPGALDEAGYVRALRADLANERARLTQPRPLRSVFIGGGTPNLFTPAGIGELLEAVAGAFPLHPQIEITMEANPGAAECGDFAGFRRAGVNRLSIGAQSFCDKQLKQLGRVHTQAQTRAALDAAAAAGFERLNIDLMYGLPEQTLDEALTDLHTALEFAPGHLSLYQLTLEPNTEFYKRPPPLPDDAQTFAMQQALMESLAEAGFARYEVSAYARDGQQCQHNLNYWQFGDYLAIGAGAHGKLSEAGAVWRCHKLKRPAAYMQALLAGKNAAVGWRQPQGAELTFEFLLGSLRLTAGFERRLYEARSGQPWAALGKRMMPFAQRGWVELSPDGLRCSAEGYRFIDSMLEEVLPEKAG